jgi:hypothetical protein
MNTYRYQGGAVNSQATWVLNIGHRTRAVVPDPDHRTFLPVFILNTGPVSDVPASNYRPGIRMVFLKELTYGRKYPTGQECPVSAISVFWFQIRKDP